MQIRFSPWIKLWWKNSTRKSLCWNDFATTFRMMNNPIVNVMKYFKLCYFRKSVFPSLGVIMFLLVACNNGNQKTTDQQGQEIRQENQDEKTIAAGPSCYLFATDRDTVYLKLNPPVNGRVTGDLNYDFFERDGNTGFIEGEIHGDTLIADYTFLSEGLISVREVGFLLEEDQVMEGYGDVEEKDGRMVFWHKDSLDFSNGLVMPEVPCDQIDQRNYDHLFPDSVLNRR